MVSSSYKDDVTVLPSAKHSGSVVRTTVAALQLSLGQLKEDLQWELTVQS